MDILGLIWFLSTTYSTSCSLAVASLLVLLLLLLELRMLLFKLILQLFLGFRFKKIILVLMRELYILFAA